MSCRNNDEIAYEHFKLGLLKRELTRAEALRAVELRLLHVVDQIPQKNTIFEVESDVSEDVLVKVVQKLCSQSMHIDVITADEEIHDHVVDRLQRELVPTTVVRRSEVSTEMTGTCSIDEKPYEVPYSLTIGPLGHFMRAEFERDVREETKQNRVAVLYRTEMMLDNRGRGLIEAYPVVTVELPITSLLCYIHRLVCEQIDGKELLPRIREYILWNSDPIRFLDEHLRDLVKSSIKATNLIEGTHFGFVRINGATNVVVTASVEREHVAIRQFLEIHYNLPVTPLRVATLKRSPLHLLKAYGRMFGVFRRGGYHLRDWAPFLTEFRVDASRVYPQNVIVTPIISCPPSATISEWIGRVDALMGYIIKVPQEGVRLVVCPSTDAMNQLWRYLKYSHDDLVSLVMIVIKKTTDELEQSISQLGRISLVTVLTTAAHFETWHTRSLAGRDVVTVFLGTPRRELRYLRRAYKFARPVKNVITVPLELCADPSSKDSGVDSDNSGWEKELAELTWVEGSEFSKPSDWAAYFIKELWGRDDWARHLSCPEDADFEKCVKWMRRKWKESSESEKAHFDVWREKMMKMYKE